MDDRMKDLQEKIIKLIIDNTTSPIEAMAMIGGAHMAILNLTLQWQKEHEGLGEASKLAAEHLDLLLKSFSEATANLDLQDALMGNLLHKIKEKLNVHSQVDNFKSFLDVLSSQKPPTKPRNTETKNMEVHQLVCRDWNFKFPIPAWIRGKHVTLEKSTGNDLFTAATPKEIEGAEFESQFQVTDQNGIQYLAFLCKKKSEYPLYILTKGGDQK
jgi:hypothetical protein